MLGDKVHLNVCVCKLECSSSTRVYIVFLCRLKQPPLFANVSFPTHYGWWLDLAVCNFAGVNFRLSPSMFLYSKGVCENSKEHFASVCRHSVLSFVFLESLMYSSVSKHLLPLKLCFLILSWEMTILFYVFDCCFFFKFQLQSVPFISSLDIGRNEASASDCSIYLCGRGSDIMRPWARTGKAKFCIAFCMLTREDRPTSLEDSLKWHWEILNPVKLHKKILKVKLI